MRHSGKLLIGLFIVITLGLDVSSSRCAFPAQEVGRDSPVSVLIDVLSRADQDRDYRNHRKAADLLGDRQAREGVPVLIKNLDSPDEKVARECAISLGKIGDRAAVRPLMERLDGSFRKAADPHVMGDAIIALGKIGIKNPDTRDGIRPLLQRFQRDGTKDQAKWAKRALGYWNE
jgi:hypothetical protein